MPMASASFQPTSRMVLAVDAKCCRNSRAAVTRNMAATTYRLEKAFVMAALNRMPMIPDGMIAATMSQNMLRLSVSSGVRLLRKVARNPQNKPTMSPQKKMTSAMILPKCKATSKASAALALRSILRSPENTTRCPELLTGINSVSPCTIPSTMLFHSTIRSTSRYDLKHMQYGRQTPPKSKEKAASKPPNPSAGWPCGLASDQRGKRVSYGRQDGKQAVG